MTLRHNLPEFKKEVINSSVAVTYEWLDGAIGLIDHVHGKLEELTRSTGTIDTGAYLASHHVVQDGEIVFEHPYHPKPGTRYESSKRYGVREQFLEAAREGGDIIGTLAGSLQPKAFSFVNDRPYAEYIEYGSSTIDARFIYGSAERAAQDYINSLNNLPATHYGIDKL